VLFQWPRIAEDEREKLMALLEKQAGGLWSPLCVYWQTSSVVHKKSLKNKTLIHIEMNNNTKCKYNRTKIYKITNDNDSMIYIGSTTQRHLSERLFLHCRDSTKPGHTTYNCKLYQHVRKYGSYYFNIELVEAYPCASDLEMRCREQYWLDQQDCCSLLNQRRAVALKRMPKHIRSYPNIRRSSCLQSGQ